MSSVFETKLRPRFIGLINVVVEKELAYKLHLPRKLHTHLVFYVFMLKPYPNHVNVEALATR